MNEKTYNGWTNYETWVVNLWMGEDGSGYWDERAREAKDTYELSQMLKDEHEEMAPETTGVFADLINAALSEVNWYEIAEGLREDIEDEDEDADEDDN